MKTKYCRYCNKDVSVADFSPLAHTKDGLSNKCKKCVRITSMPELSPAAQAVTDAYLSTPIKHGIKSSLAAALRAAADQVVPEEQRPPRRGMRPGGTGALTPEEGAEDQRDATRRRLRAIASELEAQ